MKTKLISLILVFLIITMSLIGCGKPETPIASDPVTITIAGGWEECPEIEAVGREFTAKYPNCTILYEYLQDYNDSLAKRSAGDDAVDLFFTNNIQEGSDALSYALDLNSCEGLDLTNTFDGLIDNFIFREENQDNAKLYALPLGAEMRGLYVNKTLLDSFNIAIPTDQQSFLAACEVLVENGYIPLNGNPGDFAQTLLYPWICNLIANAADPKAAYDMVNSRDPAVAELIREPLEFPYMLVENGYYDYKRAQTEYNLFLGMADEEYARDFLDIRQSGDSFEKASDVGRVAFLPSPMSRQGIFNKVKDDYHSKIEYVYMLAPVGTDGGFAYMSPAHGIAVNKNSANLEWSVKFIDFLFQPENNAIFASEFNVVPNTKDALDYISKLYEVPDERISQLGQVTFDYGFYDVVFKSLTEISKANNPKYIQTNDDGSTSLYPLAYYLSAFEESITVNEEQ